MRAIIEVTSYVMVDVPDEESAWEIGGQCRLGRLKTGKVKRLALRR